MEALPKKPADIPTTPNMVYKDEGWLDLGDWLGTGKISNKKMRENYLPFAKARKVARSLNIKNRKQWQELYREGKVPEGLPLKPERVYKGEGWVNCGDWLGTNYVAPTKRTYVSFTKARSFVASLKLGSRQEWETYCKLGKRGLPKLPKDIPATPARIYKTSGWKGWPNWLGKKSPYKIFS